MKAANLLTLRSALQYQLNYSVESKNGESFLRNIQHFGIQRALRRNLNLMNPEADEIMQSVDCFKKEEERVKAIDEAAEIEFDFKKINLDDIPDDAKIDASGVWILEHFSETDK
jgi:hypothetical protein